MTKGSYGPEFNQFDSKNFKESIGNFGTTTIPGEDQLKELRTKIRQGVKHVELHLGGDFKGQFNKLDTPDKYGTRQKRTIMRLAKLNEQTLSVHSSLNLVDLSGLSDRGFDDAKRRDTINEMEHSINFASETAKSGAVVMHMQGVGLYAAGRNDLTISKRYVDWLKKNNPKDYERIKKDFLNESVFDRKFLDNPDLRIDVQDEFNNLSQERKNEYIKRAKEKNADPYNVYFHDKRVSKLKFEREQDQVVVAGGKILSIQRAQRILNYDYLLNGNNMTQDERNFLKNNFHLDLNGKGGAEKFTINDIQRLNAFFARDKEDIPFGIQNINTYNSIKRKLVKSYEDFLEDNDNLQNQADLDFYKEFTKNKIKEAELQRRDFENMKKIYEKEIKYTDSLQKERLELSEKIQRGQGNKNDERRVRDINDELEDIDMGRESHARKQTEKEKEELELNLKQIDINLTDKNLSEEEKEALENKKQQIETQINFYKDRLEKSGYKYSIGQGVYSEVRQADQQISQLNSQIEQLKNTLIDTKSLNEFAFDKNISGLSFIASRALRNQLDLLNKSKKMKKELPKMEKKLEELREKYYKEKDPKKQDKLSEELARKEFEYTQLEGMDEYEDIDIEKNPLYVSPENMLANMGNLTGIEEYKSILRVGQDDFAKKILSDEPYFKKLREDYEKATGKKVDKKLAKQIAKNHLAGTFDTGHAGGWFKHFRRKPNESEEERILEFNKWLENEAKTLVDEGLVKHVHLNNSMGKDDDHNPMDSGILRMHHLKKIFRDAGINEPFIVEAGGRTGGGISHLKSSWSTFNASLFDLEKEVSSGYGLNSLEWLEVERAYKVRPQYSSYGMNENTFRHNPQEVKGEKGQWSGTGFF